MNNITICGNITRDPEMRTTSTGKAMVVFGVADNRNKDKTIFFECTAFDDVAQRIMRFFKKGKPIFLSGPLDAREYTSRDGQPKTALQVTVNSWDFVSVGGGGPREGGDGGSGGGYRAQPASNGRSEEPAPFSDSDVPPNFDDIPDITDPFADQ